MKYKFSKNKIHGREYDEIYLSKTAHISSLNRTEINIK